MNNVLWIAEYPTLLGGERSFLAMVPGLQNAGYRLMALAPPEGPLATALSRHNVEHLPWQPTDQAGHRLPLAQLRAELTMILQRLQPDLVHANSLSMSRVSGPVATRHGPSIGHVRDMYGISQAGVSDLNCHTRLLAVSNAARQFHIAQGVQANQILVQYNGVDTQAFCPGPATGWLARQCGFPPEAQLAGCIGQLVLRKGPDLFLEAAARAIVRQPRLRFVLAGECHSLKEEAVRLVHDLHRRADASPLAGCVRFLGTVESIHLLLPELTMLVHPARQEPLGRVLLEAAASGCPTLASQTGGTPEIFSNGESALLVPAEDPPALCQAMLTLAGDASLRERLAAAARERAVNFFDQNQIAVQLAEHYAQVIEIGRK